MNKIIPIWLIIFTITHVSFSQSVSQKELKTASKYLRKSHEDLLKLTKGLNDEQLTFKPSETEWSIIECITHITKVEEVVWGIIQKAEELSEDALNKKITDLEVMNQIESREKKFNAPPSLKPSEAGEKTYQELINELDQKRNRLMNYLNTTTINLRTYGSKNPVLGFIDVYQWALFSGAHMKRHTKQIEEIMVSNGFKSL